MSGGEPSILIVGAGPTGLALAIELQRRGVPHRLIEREPEPHQQSRATDIQPRTLEVFDNMGVVDSVLEEGVRRLAASIVANGRLLVRIVYADADTPYNFAVGLVQHRTQALLERHLESLGGRVERGVRLAHVHQDETQVSTTLLHGDQRWEELSFAWVVGCDGAHSIVRRSLGIPFEGSTFEEDFFLADLQLGDSVPHDEVLIISSTRGMAIMLPLGDGVTRIVGDLDPGFEDELDDATCTELVRGRLGPDVRVSGVGWRSLFHINTRMVDRYRKGRVLLCGDAAHIHSPVTGHGMNCGIQDAYNLGWKLALVQQGRAPVSLLDSYHAERHPVAKALLAETDIQTDLLLARNRIAHGAIATLAQLAFSLDSIHRRFIASSVEISVSYPGSPIVAEHRGTLFSARWRRSSESEEPGLSDHFSFRAGPAAGERAPDHKIDGTSVFELIRGTRHTLLLFDGMAATDDGYGNLTCIARAVETNWPDLFGVHVIVPRSDKPPALDWSGSLVFDVDASLHTRYGALSECLYVIRPDGYVGFRAQPAQLEGIEYYIRLLGIDS